MCLSWLSIMEKLNFLILQVVVKIFLLFTFLHQLQFAVTADKSIIFLIS